jgi:hypothetical protein
MIGATGFSLTAMGIAAAILPLVVGSRAAFVAYARPLLATAAPSF